MICRYFYARSVAQNTNVENVNNRVHSENGLCVHPIEIEVRA